MAKPPRHPKTATPASSKSQPDGLTETHIRYAAQTSTVTYRNYGHYPKACSVEYRHHAARAKLSAAATTGKPTPATAATPDALALWRDAYLESLAARNYAEGTLEGRRDALKVFLVWAAERELTQAGQITRPILESLPALALALHQGQRPTAGLEHPARTAGHVQRLVPLAHQTERHPPQPGLRTGIAPHGKAAARGRATLAEVGRLLAVPNVADPLGMRDRAMLELFYSTGMRRTELCRLELPDFNTERRTLHVRKGKGKKDRIVPVGEQAVHWVEQYLHACAARGCAWTPAPRPLFLTGYGGPFNPDVLSRMVSKWMEKAGLCDKGSCHMSAPHVRHPHAGRRGRHPVHPAVARP